jgi:hypothetical protein
MGPTGDLVSISQHESGEQVIVGALPDPAVLVAILKGKDDSYAILKFNSKPTADRGRFVRLTFTVMALKITTSVNKRIDFEIVGERRTVDILRGSSAEDWNLCRMIPIPEIAESNNGRVLKVQGKLLSITFRDPEARESFAKSLKVLQKKRAEQEAEFRRLAGGVFARLAQSDEEAARSRAPRLPRIGSFGGLELDSIVEIGDNESILHELR